MEVGCGGVTGGVWGPGGAWHRDAPGVGESLSPFAPGSTSQAGVAEGGGRGSPGFHRHHIQSSDFSQVNSKSFLLSVMPRLTTVTAHFKSKQLLLLLGGGPRVVVSTAAFHARVRGSVPDLGDLKETKNVSPPSTCESQYCGELP